MKDTVNQRIMQVMEYSKLNKMQFAAKIGTSTTPIYLAENGTNNPNFATISKILATFPEISAEWLLRGKGEMLLTTRDEAEILTVEELKTKIATLTEEKKRLNAIVGRLANSLSILHSKNAAK